MKFFSNCSVYKEIAQKFFSGHNLSLSGMSVGEKTIIISTLSQEKNKPFLILCADFITANNLEKMFLGLGKSCYVLKQNFMSLGLEKSNSKIFELQRESIYEVQKFLKKDLDALIVMPEAFSIEVSNFDEILTNNVIFEVGKKIDRTQMLTKLIKTGYKRSEGEIENGEFSLIGEILRIKLLSGKVLTIDFFDETVETIYFSKNEELCTFTLDSICFPESEKKENLILKLAESDCFVALDEIKKIEDEMNFLIIDQQNNKNLIKRIDFSVFFANLIKIKLNFILFQNIFINNNIFKNLQEFDIKTVGPRKYFFDYNGLSSDLKYYKNCGFMVLLCVGDKNSEKYIFEFLTKENIFPKKFDIQSFQKIEPGIYVSSLPIPMSLSFLDDKFVLLGQNDLIKKKNEKIYRVTSSKNVYLPKVGDYVVHELHGIGKCKQIERLKILDYEKDYFVIEYQNGDTLYLPSEQVNLLSAYIGGDERPKLNKIGGLEFTRLKEKVKASVKEMAFDLLKLYTEREKRKGFVYKKSSYLYDEFKKSFAFEETEDQKKAISEIFDDMESEKILDRLICGDVGYGKTEVALRAAFKAVENGKQVAFMCPTTILSEQHFNTCKKRMGEFMVNVAVLNRFRSATEQKKILKDLEEGKIDVICGTHALLSPKVKFKDLSLLILDEEQKFGVENKEKIKNLKKNIDVLTLSATPIPRTLQMSMSGIRDISLIETPPKKRLPVQTFVAEFSDKLLLDACRKELSRKGQIFILYNEIKTIEEFAAKVRFLIPDARVGVAHGAMSEKDLQKTISKMYTFEFDIIIATTLIENGVDNPLANTLVVINADRLGLSDLYQLKGRVGRSDKPAYAYFTFEPQKILTDDAYKRLEALSQFTELGSGFKIALRDLEIRGAGDVLGKHQHGHLQKIGYDLYNKLVAETVKELKCGKTEQFKEIKMEVALSSFLPQMYIQNESDRIDIYSMLSQIKTQTEFYETLEKITEDFGRVPLEVKNLAKIAFLKNLAQQNFVKKVVINKQVTKFVLHKIEKILTEKLSNVLSENKNQVFIKMGADVEIVFNIKGTNEEKLNYLIDLMA